MKLAINYLETEQFNLEHQKPIFDRMFTKLLHAYGVCKRRRREHTPLQRPVDECVSSFCCRLVSISLVLDNNYISN